MTSYIYIGTRSHIFGSRKSKASVQISTGAHSKDLATRASAPDGPSDSL